MGRDGTHGGEARGDAPDGEEPAGDLHGGRRERAAHEAEQNVEHLQCRGGLHVRGRRADRIVGGASAGVQRGEARGEERRHPDEGRCRAGFDGSEEGIVLRRLLGSAVEVGEGLVEDEGPASGREQVVRH